jgi:hypothetical protein
MQKDCSEGCGRPAVKRGMCNRDYLRWRKATPPAERAARPRLGLTPADRFFAFVNKMGPIARNRPDLGRCWLWTGGKDPKGYGIFWAGGTSHRAHIWSYKMFVSLVPDGLDLDHFACDRTSCVNYQHVRPATHWENVLRSSGPAAINALKEKCPDGHDFDEANTRINSKGARECLKCKRKQQRELKQAQRAVQRGYAPLAAGRAVCPLGHELATQGRAFKDGTLVCLACTAPAPARSRSGRPRKTAA